MEELTAVVTIYKVKYYLNKCLDSIKNQTFNNYHVLMIVADNDADCIEICNSYSKLDPRFEIIASPPHGLSDARNVGIKNTKTSLVTFIDGDDYLPQNAFEILMKAFTTSDIDISIGNYAVDDGSVHKVDSSFTNGLISRDEVLKRFFVNHGIQFVTAWGKIYKTSLFIDNDIVYPVGALHEDNLTTYKLYNVANKCYCDMTNSVYVYVNRKDSLSYNANLKKEHILLDNIENVYQLFKDEEDLKPYIESYHIGLIVSYLQRVIRSTDTNKYSIYLNETKALSCMDIIGNHEVRNRMKVVALLMKNCKPLGYLALMMITSK